MIAIKTTNEPPNKSAGFPAGSTLRAPSSRIVRIPNTLHLDRLWVSESLRPELAGRGGVTIGSPEPLRFTADGTLAGLT